jgi:hypothetical protein
MKTLIKAVGLFISLSIAALAADVPDAGAKLATVVRGADAVTIHYFLKGERRERSVTFTDDGWRERLAVTLAAGVYSPRDHCFCVSTPRISLSRKGEEVGSLSVHHREKLRAYVDGLNGDFFVGAELGTAVVNLAMEKEGLLKAATGESENTR